MTGKKFIKSLEFQQTLERTMNNRRWMWCAEKFRNRGMPFEAVDAYNPAPLLVKAQSYEELTEIVDTFNSDYGYTDLYDDGLVIQYSGIVTRSTIDFFQLDKVNL